MGRKNKFLVFFCGLLEVWCVEKNLFPVRLINHVSLHCFFCVCILMLPVSLYSVCKCFSFLFFFSPRFLSAAGLESVYIHLFCVLFFTILLLFCLAICFAMYALWFSLNYVPDLKCNFYFGFVSSFKLICWSVNWFFFKLACSHPFVSDCSFAGLHKS